MTGPRRGTVWLVGDVGAYPYPDESGTGFLDRVRRRRAGGGWWD